MAEAWASASSSEAEDALEPGYEQQADDHSQLVGPRRPDAGEESEADEWEATEGESDGSEEAAQALRSNLLGFLMGRAAERSPASAWTSGMARLPVATPPLQGDLAAELNAACRAGDIGQAAPIWSCVDAGFDASQLPALTTEQQCRLWREQQAQHQRDRAAKKAHTEDQQQQPQQQAQQQQQQQQQQAGPPVSDTGLAGLAGMLTRRRAAAAATAAARAASGAAHAAAPAGEQQPAAGSGEAGLRLVNTAQLLLKREVSLSRNAGFSRAQQRQLGCRALPLYPQQLRDSMHSRAYIGQYSPSGDFFIAAYQDRRVRLYDLSDSSSWRLRKDVTTRMTRWTITDTTMSPDQRLLVYSSISPVAFVVNVGSGLDTVESLANITELHEPLAFDGSQAPAGNRRRTFGDGSGSDDDDAWAGSFGIWSIAWCPQGGQLIAGTNNNACYVYDIEAKTSLIRLTDHQDDVNAVAYLDGCSPHLIVTGSDDNHVRLFDVRDRRTGTIKAAQGVLVGHTEGITHIDAKGDGRHLISNCKDQTIKLWDVRRALSRAAAAAAGRRRPRVPRWDYRWEEYPAGAFEVKHPDDCSLMTYRGHEVLQTLIRAYFSPAHTTGQRYVYSGSADGRIQAWDVVTGKQVACFEHHTELVRDCSWHPYEPALTSVSFDGCVVSFGCEPGAKLRTSRRGDVGRYF